jgi:hypothetical protein
MLQRLMRTFVVLALCTTGLALNGCLLAAAGAAGAGAGYIAGQAADDDVHHEEVHIHRD